MYFCAQGVLRVLSPAKSYRQNTKTTITMNATIKQSFERNPMQASDVINQASS